MNELMKYIRSLLGFSIEEDKPNTSQKRRLEEPNPLEPLAKLRRRLSKMEDDWTDFPMLRATYLKNRRPTIRVSTDKTNRAGDVVEISDDDEPGTRKSPVISLTSPSNYHRHLNGSAGTSSATVTPLNVRMSNSRSSSISSGAFYSARRSLNPSSAASSSSSSRFSTNGRNDSVRLKEQQMYQYLLEHSPRTSFVYGQSSLFDTPATRKSPEMSNSRARKMVSIVQRLTSTPIVDLTAPATTATATADDKQLGKVGEPIVIKDTDSESSSSNGRQKVQPVNSLKKILDTAPVTDPNYLKKLEEERQNRLKDSVRQIEEARRQRDKFKELNRENISKHLEHKLKYCKITDVIIVEEDDDEQLKFPEFTSDQETQITKALNCPRLNQLFISKFNLEIKASDIKLLRDKEWLNDEVINFYVSMIQERSAQNAKLPKVYAFSTFFYPKLIGTGYETLRRWTKRVDIFAHDIIVVPVHLGFHWCMALIDFRDKTIRYYDSMLGKNNQCLNALAQYLVREHRDKKKSEYDVSDWKKILMSDIPRQMNGSDCGVFSCTFAEFVTRNAKILFTQEHMPYIRRKMALEILQGKLIT